VVRLGRKDAVFLEAAEGGKGAWHALAHGTIPSDDGFEFDDIEYWRTTTYDDRPALGHTAIVKPVRYADQPVTE